VSRSYSGKKKQAMPGFEKEGRNTKKTKKPGKAEGKTEIAG